MASFEMLARVAVVRTDVSEELRTSSEEIRSVHQLLLTPNVVPSSPFLVVMMVEALSSSETSVRTRSTLRNIPKHTILQIVTLLDVRGRSCIVYD
jgi:hypothetical protein